MTETDLWWVFKVRCGNCGWHGYSDQCSVGSIGMEPALQCPDCDELVLPVWRSKE